MFQIRTLCTIASIVRTNDHISYVLDSDIKPTSLTLHLTDYINLITQSR